MKRFYIIIAFLFCLTSGAYAQSIHCPASGNDFEFIGPKLKTDIYGRTKAICGYYFRRRLIGTLEVFYFQNSDRQKPCGSRIYSDAHSSSEDFQVYGFFTDNDKRDQFKRDYWQRLLDDLVDEAEKWALPCDAGNRMFRRSIDVREKSK